MGQPTYPLVNGVRFSFASIEAKFNGQIFIGIKSVNYEGGMEPVMLYGAHPDPLGDTLGQATYTADAEFYLSEMDQLVSALGNGFMSIHFDINISYSSPGEALITDVLKGCRIKKIGASQATGGEPLSRKLDFSVLKIVYNTNNNDDNVPVPLTSPPVSSFGLTI